MPCTAKHAMTEFAVIHSSNIHINARVLMIGMNVLMHCLAEHSVIQFAVIHPIDI
jgi:hypothetical protein